VSKVKLERLDKIVHGIDEICKTLNFQSKVHVLETYNYKASIQWFDLHV
jgi:hypothetical protein